MKAGEIYERMKSRQLNEGIDNIIAMVMSGEESNITMAKMLVQSQGLEDDFEKGTAPYRKLYDWLLKNQTYYKPRSKNLSDGVDIFQILEEVSYWPHITVYTDYIIDEILLMPSLTSLEISPVEDDMDLRILKNASIQKLKIQNVRFSEIPKDILGMESLKELSLVESFFKRNSQTMKRDGFFRMNMTKLKNLEKIYISNCGIGSKEYFPDWFDNLPKSVNSVKLWYNNIYTQPNKVFKYSGEIDLMESYDYKKIDINEFKSSVEDSFPNANVNVWQG